MKGKRLALWLGIPAALLGCMIGLHASSPVIGGTFAGLLAGALCAIRVVHFSRSRHAA